MEVTFAVPSTLAPSISFFDFSLFVKSNYQSRLRQKANAANETNYQKNKEMLSAKNICTIYKCQLE
jgi:hypothetical protein